MMFDNEKPISGGWYVRKNDDFWKIYVNLSKDAARKYEKNVNGENKTVLFDFHIKEMKTSVGDINDEVTTLKGGGLERVSPSQALKDFKGLHYLPYVTSKSWYQIFKDKIQVVNAWDRYISQGVGGTKIKAGTSGDKLNSPRHIFTGYAAICNDFLGSDFYKKAEMAAHGGDVEQRERAVKGGVNIGGRLRELVNGSVEPAMRRLEEMVAKLPQREERDGWKVMVQTQFNDLRSQVDELKGLGDKIPKEEERSKWLGEMSGQLTKFNATVEELVKVAHNLPAADERQKWLLLATEVKDGYMKGLDEVGIKRQINHFSNGVRNLM